MMIEEACASVESCKRVEYLPNLFICFFLLCAMFIKTLSQLYYKFINCGDFWWRVEEIDSRALGSFQNHSKIFALGDLDHFDVSLGCV